MSRKLDAAVKLDLEALPGDRVKFNRGGETWPLGTVTTVNVTIILMDGVEPHHYAPTYEIKGDNGRMYDIYKESVKFVAEKEEKCPNQAKISLSSEGS